MKKIVLILSALAFVACGGSEKKDVENFTYEERVADICDCFKKADNPEDCHILQADHIQYLKDDEVLEFIKTTNECNTK